jgi:hypothetical protein
MQRRHVEDASDAAIAAEMGITVSAVRAHISKGWKKIRAYLQRPTRIEHLHHTVTLARQARHQEQARPYRAEAHRLLHGMQGPPRPDPSTPLLDENYRKVAGRDPLVDVHDAEEVIRRAEERRMRRREGKC